MCALVFMVYSYILSYLPVVGSDIMRHVCSHSMQTFGTDIIGIARPDAM